MRAFLIRWLASAIALVAVAQGVDGFDVEGFRPAVLAVAVLAVGNLLLQPLAAAVKSAGCLLNFLTLGLFEAVVSFVFWVLVFFIVGAVQIGGRPFVAGFRVEGLQPAFIGALALALMNLVLSPVLNKGRDRERRRDRREA